MSYRTSLRILLAIFSLFCCSLAQAQGAKNMSFFVTSVGLEKGGDLGGLEGADRHCQALATAAGAGHRSWRAYLSTSGAGTVDARDRIGKGPWVNVRGVVIANDIEHLHANNGIDGNTARDERDVLIDRRKHDMLTGSRDNGRAFPADRGDRTCGNWTSSGEGVAMVGHHDRTGLGTDAESRSWNSSHRSRGCSQNALVQTGGAGLFYCFAAD